MNRRSVAIVTGFLLLFAGGAAGAFVGVPFVRYSPGLTIDVLGTLPDGEPVLEVQGHRTYPTDGELRMTTVSTTNRDARPTIVEALWAWADPDEDLYPYESIYPDPDETREDDRTQARLQMVSSQDLATAAALTELGFDLKSTVQVSSTVPDGPAEGVLRPHDVIVAVDGQRIRSTEQLGRTIGAKEPGDDVTIRVRRDARTRTFEITTEAAADDPSRAVIGIYAGTGFDLPFEVSFRVPERIGGPSAGLMLSLAVYDTLTPGSLTGGVRIAGTGSIDETGQVGKIGGIRQKIGMASEEGMQLFLVPAGDCPEALLADNDSDMRLVRAESLHTTIEAIEAYVDDPDASLPSCSGTAS